MTQAIKLKFRKGIVVDLLDEWLPRAYRLTYAGATGANPDQRIHEDAHHLADLCADLGIGLFQSSLLLAAFIGVLWKLSENFGLVWHHHRLPIPGYMVWCALLYAFAASFLSWRVEPEANIFPSGLHATLKTEPSSQLLIFRPKTQVLR